MGWNLTQPKRKLKGTSKHAWKRIFICNLLDPIKTNWSNQIGCAVLGCCRQNIFATINSIFLSVCLSSPSLTFPIPPSKFHLSKSSLQKNQYVGLFVTPDFQMYPCPPFKFPDDIPELVHQISVYKESHQFPLNFYHFM